MLSTNKKNTWALFLNQSVQGASHKRDDKPLQDFSISGSAEFSNSFLQKTRVVYAIVADGHGGAKYFRSARGSQLACVLCENSIQQLFNEKVIDVIDENKIRNVLSHFCNRLILNWRDTVIKDFKQNELSENEKIICDKEKINSITIFLMMIYLLFMEVRCLRWYVYKISFGLRFNLEMENVLELIMMKLFFIP